MSIKHSPLTPLSSLLIANRGEIATRIIRTCRKMGIRSIAVYSEADRQAPFVRLADTAVHIGESSPAVSYLDQDKIIEAAKRTKADAIHPGYGFLSENAGFARRCAAEGIMFVGPRPEAIEAMGSKASARELMMQHKVPVVPGYEGEDQSLATLQAEAERIGFPVLLKAAAGGGGKGMRIVHAAAGVKAAIDAAKREALSAFGDDRMIVEKYIASGRHLEFQIFGDQHGKAIHLLERECSIQRRYQKVIEESPSPVMDAALRSKMGEAAVLAAKALQYDNAGTVEFIYDDRSGDFYFLEVNTRLQVEHPVTEEITGLDLVKMQIESAQGYPLSLSQEDVVGNGYAIECRLYAEDPENDFLPVTGKIVRFEVPEVEGLRVESAIESGSEISVFYDPMIAKLIVWDQNRASALRKMQYVLRNLICLGMTTNQRFLLDLMSHPDFLPGQYNTHFIRDKMTDTDQNDQARYEKALIAATVYRWWKRDQKRPLLAGMPSGWRNNFYQSQQDSFFLPHEEDATVWYRQQHDGFAVTVGENQFAVSIQHVAGNEIRLEINGQQHQFELAESGDDLFLQHEGTGSIHLQVKSRFPAAQAEKVAGGYESPMPSQIVSVLVEAGQTVKAGDALLVLSSMKMENTITASEGGVVEEIYTEAGAQVPAGFLLLKINSES
ncbi:MAG: acetyl-CoA carboxylase biotin carboxylase subunit [Bacteroidota bacterium]